MTTQRTMKSNATKAAPDEVRTNPPPRPTALMNFRKTDDALAKIVGNFWQLVWGNTNAAIDQKTKYLLSLANAVGARRFRQATRELTKAYAPEQPWPSLTNCSASLSGTRGRVNSLRK